MLKSVVEGMTTRQMLPKEFMGALNDVELLIIQHELDVSALTYNKLKTVCSFLWDFNIQLYPHVDLVILQRLEYQAGHQLTFNLVSELQDPYFWDMYISADTK
jgi:hypothetical protein